MGPQLVTLDVPGGSTVSGLAPCAPIRRRADRAGPSGDTVGDPMEPRPERLRIPQRPARRKSTRNVAWKASSTRAGRTA